MERPSRAEPSAAPQAQLMTIDEAAAYLNVPARWVGDAARQHRLRCTRLGKHVRFRREHLDELIDACEQPVLDQPNLSLVGQPQRHSARFRL